ncbi:restriction endonuclease subunit S [Clostridium perfringens]|nr:restriction endonuclease subunit S [Clostridium perfringens]
MNRKMKDSGIKWIGLIPNEYRIAKVKSLFNIGRGRVISLLDIDDNGEYPVYSSQTKNDGCLGYINTYDFDCSQLTWTTDGANAGTVFLREGKHNCTNVCGTLLPKNNINNIRYLKYALEYIAVFHKRADTNGFKIMNNEMAEIKIILPPIEEQDLIANYLDKKVSQIDKIIEITNTSIEEYRKYKESLITEVVTKGLNSSAKMKDSGVAWNKRIPVHWEVVNGKRLFEQRKEKAFEGDKQLTASQKHGVIYQEDFMRIENQKVVLVEKDFSILKHVEPNDFVISMRSFQGGLEYSKLRGCISSAYVMLIPNEKVYAPYFRWLFKSVKYINALQSTSNLVRDGQAMRYSNFVQIPLFILPKEEQKEIADYLDKKCIEIDNIIEQKQKLLIEMESYKKSLIYECVTGKREVK